MRHALKFAPLLAALACILTIATNALAGDWPAFRHDVARSGATDEKLAFPMHETWRYRAAQAPRPAWPEPFHILNRLDFDYAPHPVTGGGLVYFGSTADDAVRALDAKTGEQRWAFVSGGPVRFAPQFVAGKIYFGSDDGYVYCLDAPSGKLLWKFRSRPDDDMFIGNQRMISRWPIRTGVLVMDNTVYLTGGMWNPDGIHLCALNADTGDVIWRNDNTGFVSIFFKGSQQSNRTTPLAEEMKNPTHEGEFGSTGISPQGALLAAGDNLLVPNGIAFPARFTRSTGAYKPWETHFSPAPGVGGAWGGTWACIDGGFLYTLMKYRQDQLGLASFAINTVGGVSRSGARATLPQLNVQPPGLGSKYRPKEVIHDKGKVSIVVSKGKVYSRQAYALALTDKTLLIGLDGEIVAQDADSERELWRAPVEGIVREISIADGRVYASTNRGVIHCFEVGKADAAPMVHDPGAALTPQSLPKGPLIEQLRATGADSGYALVLGDADAHVSLQLAAATRLNVINVQTDEKAVAPLRDRIVATTSLYGSRVHVIGIANMDRLPFARYFANAVILAGPVPGISARELYRALRPFGGVLLTPGLSDADAGNLLREAGAGPDELAKIPNGIARAALAGARDWNRIIPDRAAAGPMRVLWFGGPDTDQTQNLRQSLNYPIAASGKYLALAESRLTAVDAYNGAIHWSREIPRKNRDLREIDGVVYYVVEGGRPKQAAAPTSIDEPAEKETTANPKQVVDDSQMVSMDASADQTGGGRTIRMISPDKAYLVLGQDPDDMWIELDLRTGAQRHMLDKWTAPSIISLQKPQSWPLEFDPAHSGALALEAAVDGVLVTLTTKDPVITKLDTWELYFDFRPTAERCGLYERGAFHLIVTPALKPGVPATCINGNGPIHPAVQVGGDSDGKTTRTTVKLTWAELTKITGGKPASFGFGATLNSYDNERESRIYRRHVFADWASDTVNNGWANVFVGEAPASVEAPTIIAPLAGDIRKRFPDAGRIATNRNFAPTLDDISAMSPRIHPLTGELEPKIYRPGTGGCGGPQYSSTTRFGRATGNFGLYDFIDDSGLRNISGIKAGCSTPITTALGLVIISPEGGHCVCTFPFATTVTLAPADRRLNEDWAIYHDRPADTLVRQAAINLGAFGDRRDEQGTLWLGFPRPGERALNYSYAVGKNTAAAAPGTWMRFLPASMQVPLSIEYLDPARSHKPEDDMLALGNMWGTWTPNRLNKEFGPYRVSSDVVQIASTKQPWLYSHGYRGIKKATMQLDFRTPLAATAAEAKPVIDGKLDAAWGDKPDTVLPHTKAKIFFRQDADTLYVAMTRPTVVNRLGKIAAWSKNAKGEDAAIWEDDSCEVFLSDAASGKVVHLGISASGARFDALAADASPLKEDAKWNGAWTGAATGDESSLTFELAIPLATLTQAGLQKDRLAINAQINQKDTSAQVLMYPGGHGRLPGNKETVGEALSFLGNEGREHCRNFVPLGIGAAPATAPRRFTVRLHFAELDDVKPGERVFDIKLQGNTVLKDFDIAKAAGVRAALVKEFKHIEAGDSLTVEFSSSATELTRKNAPIISALELLDEGFVGTAAGPVR